jgi:RNA polymerase subunit RPABC4/transcription elongation factor Spt4
LKQCSRCGTDILTGQLVCPHCGKPQRRPRRVRCRHCGTVASRSLETCPGCGEPLRQGWLRPLVTLVAAVVGVAAVALVAFGLWQAFNKFQPTLAVSTVQAVASEVPVLVEVPTLTPSLTPSSTPTPTNTPTATTTPSMTPTPTLTATPTETPSPTPTETPSPTATRVPPTATPTVLPSDTPTPVPTAPPPTLLEPADGEAFGGKDAIVKLVWSSGYTLGPDECFRVTVQWTEQGAMAANEVCVQDTLWFMPESLYLRADQETDRLYSWSVEVARRITDVSSNVRFQPFSPSSEERSFHWR